MDPIIKQLRAEREARNWSQRHVAELANMAGGARQYLGRLEGGLHSPELSTLRRWAEAFGFDVVLVKREG